MGQILVRQIDDAVLLSLKARAKANDRSAEAEVRAIIAEAVMPKRETIASLVGAGKTSASFRRADDIVAHVRSLRDE
jgi:plasmid stability protein